jgi:hypothetical protein
MNRICIEKNIKINVILLKLYINCVWIFFTSEKIIILYIILYIYTMNTNVGCTIQKIINNTPVRITSNNTSVAVGTSGGNVYNAGLISEKICTSFRELLTNENVVGNVIDVQASNDKYYLLNSAGSVFEYDMNAGSCKGYTREIYYPLGCDGDKAVKISVGDYHVIILTEKGKVWGAGDNSEYQLVPQGQSSYESAVQLYISDINVHDNENSEQFIGKIGLIEASENMSKGCETNKCNQVKCIKEILTQVKIGNLGIFNTEIKFINGGEIGTLKLPIYGDIEYNGFLCVGSDGFATGTLTYTVKRLYLKCGINEGIFTYPSGNLTINAEVNLNLSSSVILMDTPQTFTKNINVFCNESIVVNFQVASINPPISGLENVVALSPTFYGVENVGSFIALTSSTTFPTNVSVVCQEGAILTQPVLALNVLISELQFVARIECCEQVSKCLKQPCWIDVYAGFNTSVLVDNCYRLYVLGSIHKIRSNKNLLKRTCLDSLLQKTNASVNFYADQLNCGVENVKETCSCNKCNKNRFTTDLNKFGVSLTFPQEQQGNCKNTNMGVCDFLKNLKRCNEKSTCDSVCEPCDGYIYVNIYDPLVSCPNLGNITIDSLTLYNKKSVCKINTENSPKIVEINVNVDTVIEFDMNAYCIDGKMISAENVVILRFRNLNTNPPPPFNKNIQMYVDIDKKGGIKFEKDNNNSNVKLTVLPLIFPGGQQKTLLNFGPVLDPLLLVNLKHSLKVEPQYNCPGCDTTVKKLINVYVKGGDHISFIESLNNSILSVPLMVTADIPTVFKFTRRILDIGLGDNNLSVLVGGVSCPNETFVIGNNCYGQLGIDSQETQINWKQVNRCDFDCQIRNIFSGKNVTFYITQSFTVYATGLWKNLVNSLAPEQVKQICDTWKIKDITVNDNTLILLGSDGCIFGMGSNSLGQLGLTHCSDVCKLTPLSFFNKLTNNLSKNARCDIFGQKNECQDQQKKAQNKYIPNSRICSNKNSSKNNC